MCSSSRGAVVLQVRSEGPELCEISPEYLRRSNSKKFVHGAPKIANGQKSLQSSLAQTSSSCHHLPNSRRRLGSVELAKRASRGKGETILERSELDISEY